MSNIGGAVAGDVVVVGGGAAGLTAALVLARARHRVTVVDDRTHRNATVDEFHGFPTRDATAPDRFRIDALAELQAYGVTVNHSAVTERLRARIAAWPCVWRTAPPSAATQRCSPPAYTTSSHRSTGSPPGGASRCSTVRSATDGNIATNRSS